MNIADAARIVIADTHESYPDMGDADALAFAYDTVRISQIDASSLETARAYHIVLNRMGALVDDTKGPRLSPAQAAREVLA